jgi:rifamycin polyketide synthase module 9/10
LVAAVAELFVRGVGVDWAGVLPSVVGWVDLPTYAFDHHHYWLNAAPATTDAASLGLAGADHPMLGALVRLPQTDGLVFTSRLSLRSHPWLADHRIGQVVLVPGTGLVELAVRAGDEVGCPVLEELVIEAPLVVPEHGGVRVQVAVSGPVAHGSRTIDVYSQRDDEADTWTRHATGVLSTAPATHEHRFDFTTWPPPGARPVDISDGYGRLARAGFGYGPTFQAVRAVWRRGEEIFAEVALPEDARADAAAFGIHPALLDAALHAGMLDASTGGSDPHGRELRLPFAWNGLRLHAAGATVLRTRVTGTEADAMTLQAADEAGGPVVTMESLVGRPVSGEQLTTAAAGTARADSLFRVEWTELWSAPGGTAPSWVPVADAEQVATLADDVLSGTRAPAAVVLDAVGGTDADADDAVLELTTRVLDVLQCWLAGGGFEESRLVVATRGAVPAGDGLVTDPAGAAVWGLVRAAQAENPDRIVLVDLDPAAGGAAEAVLGPVLASGEPQVAVRGATLSVPRLARATGHGTGDPAVFGPEGTVLVTGGTGSLGALAARHLVTRYGVRHLVLASRRGPDAEGVRELVADLSGQGASVSVAACDLSDRDQLAALLAAVPAEHPLTGVVHTAGVSDAGVIGTVTPDRLAEVFAPKVDAVRHLDELTRGTDLAAFVVYSSVSGVFMGAGSGSYAAANAFLDGVVARRRAAGLPGLSLAWGVWEQSTGMAAHTDDLTRTRMNRRGGLLPLTPEEGMDLFDAAVASGQVTVVPAKLDLRRVRADAAAGADVPHMLRGLVRVGRQLAHTAGVDEERVPLDEQLAGLSAAERAKVLLDLARAEVAAVLGYSATHHIDPDQGLFEIGFDSLTAIELRNRFRTITGRKISPNLVFDHPTPAMLAAYLEELMHGAPAAAPVATSV